MKKVTLPCALGLGLLLLVVLGLRVYSECEQCGRDTFWPGTLASELGRNTVPSEPQQQIDAVAAAFREHKLDDLIKDYRKKAASESDSAVAHFRLGYAYYVRAACDYRTPGGKEDYFEMARRELQEAIKLDPLLEEAYMTLGAYYVQQNPVKAVEFLAHYLEQAPGDAEAMYWIAMAYGSRAGEVQGNAVTAEDKARHAGRYCYDGGKMIAWLRKASQASPGWLLVHRCLENSYIRRGETKTESGQWIVAEPWKGLAVEECKTVLKLASPTRDSELIDRIKRRLDELTKE
jgi:tetratricopeptide (TPR) repeat protein